MGMNRAGDIGLRVGCSQRLTRERLAEAARTLGVAELAVPRRIQHVESLPLLGTGKVDHVTLKRLCDAL